MEGSLKEPRLADATILSYHEVLVAAMEGAFREVNLVGVGAPRSGTSSLYYMLGSSAEVFVSPVKEANYFGVYDDESRLRSWSDVEYGRLFIQAEAQRYVADVTPIYLSQPKSACRLHEYNNKCKIIITLRDPVRRLFSQFKHHREWLREADFERYARQALEHVGPVPFEDWYHPATNARRSLYSEDIERYADLFGWENVLIIFYEDLEAGPQIWSRTLENFLQLSTGSLVPPSRQNMSINAEFAMSAEIAERLKEFFAADVAKVQELAQRDLSQIWTMNLP